ncbi:MAG: M48 family metalloprotease [Desulfovibrio sp.]|jgi:predicted Zn-dependent protease|nr:M48 family metalloprotease [Desulfovibrio sp.]
MGSTTRHPLLCRLTALFTLTIFLASQIVPMPAAAFIFGGVTVKDEKEMGQKFDIMVRSSMPVVDDPEVRQYVGSLLERLVKAIPPQPYAFKATTILHNSLNAFAVPGGYVYVFTGLIMNMDSEEALAGVLSHELAHVTQRHVASRLERAQFITVASLLLAVAGVAVGGSGGGALSAGALGAGQSAMLNYSRMDETEADQIGLQYLIAAKYPPAGMISGFKTLRQKSFMSGTSVPTYLSTHPAIGDRINGLQARIATMPPSVQNRTQDNKHFVRVRTLLWARYGDEQSALQRFSGKDGLSAMGRGIVRSRQNNILEAGKAFDEALAAAPGDPLVLREAGIFHFRKGDLHRADGLLREAMRLDQHDYMASFFYARMLDESGKQAQADKYYEDVLRHVPEDSEVHEAYARSLGKSGKSLEAYIHLTYSALYANNKKLADRYFDKTKGLAGGAPGNSQFRRLENVYKERKEIWDKN